MKTRTITVQCEGGLHLRVAAAIAQQVQGQQSRVCVRCEGCPRADACSVFELLQLGAARGTKLEVTAEGPDEDATLETLSGLFCDGAGI